MPELRDALTDAGFARSEVYSELSEERTDCSVRTLSSLDEGAIGESYILCVAGRT